MRNQQLSEWSSQRGIRTRAVSNRGAHQAAPWEEFASAPDDELQEFIPWYPAQHKWHLGDGEWAMAKMSHGQ
jgi:hypothetical protein